MAEFAIRVENISKRYRIGVKDEVNDTFAGEIVSFFKNPIAKVKRLRKLSNFDDVESSRDIIWALKNISFDIQPGEVVGIIGRNGAGKSTLLKILSRITYPTGGRIEINGRVSSLLEVGTGFHPELTGRENIYLNGTILGMTKKEIDQKFEQIVDFSGVEKFIDTPVKWYSSGMRVRLAFSVAAHLEPEILLVDEVLAVGDAEFQKKCLGKMSEVAQDGRTVLFVSHNLTAIQNLCNTAILISDGQIKSTGQVNQIVNHYLDEIASARKGTKLAHRTDRKGDQSLKFIDVEICDENGLQISKILSGQDAYLRFHYVCKKPKKYSEVQVSFVLNENEHPLSNINTVDSGYGDLRVYSEGFFECQLPNVNITARTYNCSLFCSLNGIISDWVEHAFIIEFEDGDFFGSGKKVGFQSRVLFPQIWKSVSKTG
jgi:lipopolysaccharide transport system ATP-binding protein